MRKDGKDMESNNQTIREKVDAVHISWCITADVLIDQVYFKDAWNVFDFITVIGSGTEVMITQFSLGLHEVRFRFVGNFDGKYFLNWAKQLIVL